MGDVVCISDKVKKQMQRDLERCDREVEIFRALRYGLDLTAHMTEFDKWQKALKEEKKLEEAKTDD